MQFYSWSCLLCTLVVTQISSSMEVLGIHFNTSGYEHCTFNLAQNDGNTNMDSQDLVEGLLVQTVGFQLWTIFQIFRTSNGQFLTNVNVTNFKELCSVNIVVSLGEGFKLNLRPIFHNRLFSTKNTFIIVLGSDLESTYAQQYKYAFDETLGSPYFASFYLFSNTNTASVCFFCSPTYQFFRLPMNMNRRNLREIRNLSSEIVKISTDPIIPIMGAYNSIDNDYDLIYVKKYLFLYKVRRWVNPIKIGCDRDLIPIVNAANFLNVSIILMKYTGPGMINEVYIRPRVRNPVDKRHYYSMFHYYAVLLVRLYELNSPISTNTLSERSFNILEKNVERFIYCVEYEEREGFTFLFWIAAPQWTSGLGLVLEFPVIS